VVQRTVSKQKFNGEWRNTMEVGGESSTVKLRKACRNVGWKLQTIYPFRILKRFQIEYNQERK